MIGASALLRLLGRPLHLWVLFPLFWAVAIPVLLAADAGVSPAALWHGTDPDRARLAAWHLGVLVPVVLGVGVAVSRLELEAAPFAWTLPGLRGGLLRGTLLTAALAAAGASFLALRTAPVTDGAAFAAAAFALAVFWFVSAGAAIDLGVPRWIRWPAPLPLLVAGVRPGVLVAGVEAAPWAWAALAAALTAVLLAVQFSPAAARRRGSRWSMWAPLARTELYPWGGPAARDASWRGSLAGERVWPWLRAAYFERSGGRGALFPGLIFATVAGGVLFAHLIDGPLVLLIFTGILLQDHHFLLAPGFPHPVSRRLRAELVALGALLSTVAFVAVAVGAVLAVTALGVPTLGWDEAGVPMPWSPVIAMMIVWAPFVQWGGIVWPMQRLEAGVIGRRYLLFMAYALGGIVCARMLADVDPVPLWVASTALAVVGYSLFRVASHRHFERVDLTGAPG